MEQPKRFKHSSAYYISLFSKYTLVWRVSFFVLTILVFVSFFQWYFVLNIQAHWKFNLVSIWYCSSNTSSELWIFLRSWYWCNGYSRFDSPQVFYRSSQRTFWDVSYLGTLSLPWYCIAAEGAFFCFWFAKHALTHKRCDLYAYGGRLFVFHEQVCRVLRGYYFSALELVNCGGGAPNPEPLMDRNRVPRQHLKEARLRVEEALGACLLPSLQLIPANPAVGQEIWEVMNLLPYEVGLASVLFDIFIWELDNLARWISSP